MIKRKIFKSLQDHLSRKEISLIIGPRQAGKTTLMLLLKEQLEKEGHPTLFLNLDIEADARFFTSQETLIRKIELELGREDGFVFIDEIQRKEDAGVFLKGIYDMNLPYKYIVSGSGSVELKRKIHESLVGRKRIFELNTLSFEEVVNFRTEYRYENKLLDFLSLDLNKAKLLLDDYLLFGGYPRVVLAKNINEKQLEISEIYQSYLEKDIAYLLQVKKTEALTNLVKIIAAQTGKLINYSELSSILGISTQTVKDYLWYLEKTFILHKLTPYFRNVRKEIRKSPVYYFFDLGLRNYAVGGFGNLNLPDIGFVFQNFVFNLLREKSSLSPASIHFWRTGDGAEVDFVVDLVRELVPIEVKWASLKRAAVSRSLRNFILQYRPAKSYIVNISLRETITIGKTKIHFIPFHELMGLNMQESL
ncbi:MAG: ATP-binding protein [Candidatus Aminicenantes bacterium]|nr:ATP-binding protein [Candidatus Aminicenantes bacterium]